MAVQNPQLTRYHLTGNRSNLVYVEGSTAWLFDCPQFLSPLFEADKCFDRVPIRYQNSVVNNDPITRQTLNYATPLSCDSNPQNVIALDLDNIEHYVLKPETCVTSYPIAL